MTREMALVIIVKETAPEKGRAPRGGVMKERETTHGLEVAVDHHPERHDI